MAIEMKIKNIRAIAIVKVFAGAHYLGHNMYRSIINFQKRSWLLNNNYFEVRSHSQSVVCS